MQRLLDAHAKFKREKYTHVGCVSFSQGQLFDFTKKPELLNLNILATHSVRGC